MNKGSATPVPRTARFARSPPKTFWLATALTYLDSKFSSNQNQLKNKPDVDYFKLPYIGNLSNHIKNKLSELCKEFCKENFNMKLVFNSFKLKIILHIKTQPLMIWNLSLYISLLVLAVVLATLAKLVVILKLGLRSISKRIISLIFLNINTLVKHPLTHVTLFVLK